MFIGDLLGRRKVIYIGVIWMVIGTVLQCTSFGITQLAIARVVTGIGNGMNTATIPTWQSVRLPPLVPILVARLYSFVHVCPPPLDLAVSREASD